MLKKSLLISLLVSSISLGVYGQSASYETIHTRFSRLSPLEQDEVIWLARCVYSESNLKHEQEVIAWVVRNRVDTGYRGSTYREVVLEPLQFSAFNSPSPRRTHILSLTAKSTSGAWLQALEVSLDVYEGDPINRPISSETRHFYSPISMVGGKEPPWARQATALEMEGMNIDPNRFLFYEEIDESLDPFMALELSPKDQINTFQEKTRERLKPATNKSSLRDRWKPTGRVKRPSRPRVSTRGGQ